jgi:DNA-binding transcriptional regulator YdaS (Cro superfamily)
VTHRVPNLFVDVLQIHLYGGVMNRTLTPLERAIDHCGGQTQLAERIGKSQQLVSYWMKAKNGVPAEYVRDIEAACEGKVTRHDLRPDIFGPAPEHAA